jgi:hypothetical protein
MKDGMGPKAPHNTSPLILPLFYGGGAFFVIGVLLIVIALVGWTKDEFKIKIRRI